MADDTVKRIIEIICDVKDGELSPEDVTPDKSFTKDLNFDSLDLANLVMKLEEAFEKEGIDEIPPEESDKLQTVGEAIAYIESRLSKTNTVG